MGHMANYQEDSFHEFDYKRNVCSNCKTHEYGEVRNFEQMWGLADLWCTKCDTKIRDMDFG